MLSAIMVLPSSAGRGRGRALADGLNGAVSFAAPFAGRRVTAVQGVVMPSQDVRHANRGHEVLAITICSNL
jgi:hypothetical protein